MFLLLLSLFLFFLFIFPFLPARDDNTTTARKRRRRRIPPFGAITRKSFKPISAVTLRNEMDFQPTASPTLSGIPRAGCRSAKQRPLHVIYVLWQQHGYLAFWCFFPICVWTPFVPPFFFFLTLWNDIKDVFMWYSIKMFTCMCAPHSRLFRVKLSSPPFPPPPLLYSRILHMLYNQKWLALTGGRKGGGGTRGGSFFLC